MQVFKQGDLVKWKWGDGYGVGEVQSVFTQKTTRKIKGGQVVRNGSKNNPALYIKQESGDAVLKLASEVEEASSS